jgi:lipopolysaccharide export system protein LptA
LKTRHALENLAATLDIEGKSRCVGKRTMTKVQIFSLSLLAVLAAASAQAAGMLPGSNSKEPYKIDANKLDYLEKENKLIYTGDVVAVQGATKMRSSVMTVYLDKTSANGEQASMKRVEMQGPVTFTLKDQIGTGDNAIYDRAENKWYLTGNVTLNQGGNVTRGQKLIYDMTTQRARIEGGRVITVLTPGEAKSGAGKK